jgi:hypothetical protein
VEKKKGGGIIKEKQGGIIKEKPAGLVKDETLQSFLEKTQNNKEWEIIHKVENADFFRFLKVSDICHVFSAAKAILVAYFIRVTPLVL